MVGTSYMLARQLPGRVTLEEAKLSKTTLVMLDNFTTHCYNHKLLAPRAQTRLLVTTPFDNHDQATHYAYHQYNPTDANPNYLQDKATPL